MHPKRPSVALALGALVFLVGLLAGCGGGGGSGGQSEGGGSQEEAGQEEAGAAKKGGAPEVKIAIGRVVSVKPDRDVIAVRPVQEEQGAKRMVFKLRKKGSQIQLDGKKAELADAKEGQQAQVEYVVRNERNRARTVELFAADGGEDKQPSGDGEKAG